MAIPDTSTQRFCRSCLQAVRVVLVMVVAPACAVAVYSLVHIAGSLGGFKDAFRHIIGFGTIGLFLAPFQATLGLGLDNMLRRRGLTAWWCYAGAGAAAGCLVLPFVALMALAFASPFALAVVLEFAWQGAQFGGLIGIFTWVFERPFRR